MSENIIHINGKILNAEPKSCTVFYAVFHVVLGGFLRSINLTLRKDNKLHRSHEPNHSIRFYWSQTFPKLPPLPPDAHTDETMIICFTP